MEPANAEVKEMILEQMKRLVSKVGNCMTYDIDTKMSEQVKNLAMAYRCLKEDK